MTSFISNPTMKDSGERSFVSDPSVKDSIEYAIVVSRNVYKDSILYLCSSQREITMNIDSEIGAWYLYNGCQLLNRIKPPVPTELFKNKQGEIMVKITAPVVHINPCPKLELSYDTRNILLSPLLGLVGAMFTIQVDQIFSKPAIYEVKAIWLPNSLEAFREIKKKCGFSFVASNTDVRVIPKNSLTRHPFIKNKPCLRVSPLECLTERQNSPVFYNVACDLGHYSHPIVVLSDRRMEMLEGLECSLISLFSDSISVYALATRIKSNSNQARKILNIGIEFDDTNEDFVFTDKLWYEPCGNLAIDYNQPHSFIQPPTKNGTSASQIKVNGNGTSANVLDFRKAVISVPPARNGHSANDDGQSSSTDGFQTVKKTKKKVEKKIGEMFDENKFNEIPPDPEANKIYTGVIVSQDNKQNYYIYSPHLVYEIQLAAASELPDDLRISDFVEFKCNMINTTYWYSRPTAEFVRKIPPLFKCGMLKNSVFIQCNLLVPSSFHPQKSPIAYTDFVPKVADKNGYISLNDVGKRGTCVITRTKQTGHSEIFWLFHKVNLIQRH